MLESHTMVYANCRHIPESEWLELTSSPGIYEWMSIDDSTVIIWLCAHPLEDTPKFRGFSKALQGLINLARKEKAGVLLIDEAGPVYKELDTFGSK